MEERTITYLTDACLITCILQKDLAEGVLEAENVQDHIGNITNVIGDGVADTYLEIKVLVKLLYIISYIKLIDGRL